MRILFRDRDHRYYLEGTDKVLTSVSKFFETFKHKFDPKIAVDYAAKGKDFLIPDLAKKWEISLAEAEAKWGHLAFTPDDIREIWNEKSKISTDRGTAFHLKMEGKDIESGAIKGSTYVDEEHVAAIDIKSLKPGEYTELIIPYLPAWLIGTADKIIIHENNEFTCRDYKGFPLDTEIPTPTGFTTMGELKVGDDVFDGDGIPTKVTNVSQVHHNPCYKITFDTNETIVCDKDHKWEIYSGLPQKYKDKIYQKKSVMTAKEIEQYYNTSTAKLRIKNSCPEFSEKVLPIDPYVLGLWLGDGNSHCGRITQMNPKVWEEIEKRGYSIGNDVSNGCSGNAQDKTIFGIYGELKKLDLLDNKHVPDIYLQSSRDQRLDLLRGFMDADGHFNRTRKRCVMETTKQWQAEAISKIVFSLGYKATTIPAKTSGFGKTNIPCFHVCFSPKENPFLSRNEDYLTVRGNISTFNAEYRYIKSIEPVEMVPTKCITVESDSHTYLVTRNYLRTHNTDKEMKFKGTAFWNPLKKIKEVKKLKPPISHVDEVNGQIYNLKMSCYCYFLEAYGFKYRDGYIDHVENVGTDKERIVSYPMTYMKKEVETMLKFYKK